MGKARDMRSAGGKGKGVRVFGSLIGHLLLRTWDRAQRVHMAMLSRGFTGEFHIRRPLAFRAPDMAFVLFWCPLFILLRCFDPVSAIGRLLLGGVMSHHIVEVDLLHVYPDGTTGIDGISLRIIHGESRSSSG